MRDWFGQALDGMEDENNEIDVLMQRGRHFMVRDKPGIRETSKNP